MIEGTMSRNDKYGKGDRALKLREQGLMPSQIAARLGGTVHTICTLIKQAKIRREKATERAKRVPQWSDGGSA